MSILIGNREIAMYKFPYVVAEIGSNHLGSLDLAKFLAYKAAKCGCDAVKVQMWTPRSLFSKQAIAELGITETELNEHCLRAYGFKELKSYCDKIKIDFTASVFSKENVDFLADVLCAPYIKIASMDINNYPLLAYAANKGLPIMLSTGMATEEEIWLAVETIENTGNKQIILLHCVSDYPNPYSTVNLRYIQTLAQNYSYPVGYSDHTKGSLGAIGAAALGAAVIEKHFCSEEEVFSLDSAVSIAPEEMRQMVSSVRTINLSLSDGIRRLKDNELANRLTMRRSIVAACGIPQGKVIKEEDLTCKRPGTGLEPGFIMAVVGKTALRDIKEDELLGVEDFA
jgi:N-acetylneuraminate synthase